MAAADRSLPIALDAMGGDHAPRETVLGAALAARELDVYVALVGRPDALEPEIAALSGEDAEARARLTVVSATEVVAMDEHPAQAVRGKRDASINVACRLVAAREARAVVSAGNSGAVLAAALLGVRRIRGVARPAIGALVPNRAGASNFVLDVGANTDAKPEWLAQFAVMGSVYATEMLGIAVPRVALLSNGEERGKGDERVQAADPLLAALPITFVGNVEGRDLFGDSADVIVCDGFAGNVALKVAEGVAEFLFATIATQARSSLRGKLGGLLLKPKLRPLRDRVDWRATGGALLLGVAGEVVIAHGRSDAVAIRNAIGVADRAAQHDVSGVVAARLHQAGAESTEAEPVPAAATSTGSDQ